MQIELNHRYKSIETLTTEDLPDFAVLIGRNGAGKTQLLEALRGGAASIPGVGVDEIEMYDMVTFGPPNTRQADRNSYQFAQITADAYLVSQSGGRSPIEIAATIYDQFARKDDASVHDLTEEIRYMPDFTVFAVNDRESPYKSALYEQVLAPLNRGQGKRSSDQSRNSFYGNSAALLSAAMKLTSKLPHELTREDIMRASHCEGDTLSNSISAVFGAYKVDQFTWAHEQFDTDAGHVSRSELISEYRTKYRPPWEVLREILSEMWDAAGDDGLFDFDFSDPEDHEIRVSNYEHFSFTAAMTNRTTGAEYNLDSLSSGEKILMALCLVSFNRYLGRRAPKLLLLDELDALLHPSMVEALVRTLKTLFVSEGTKVLMTSHSAMTMAALNEDDIFRVIRTGSGVQIAPTSKTEAVNELSEGLATVDKGLRIAAYDEAKVTILTEGHNTKHLKRWVELNFPEDVHVFEDLEQHSNDDQLLAYGRLLAMMHTNTHFVIVWDCDAAGKAEALSRELHRDVKITPYAFPKRLENTIAQRGIENNYDESILEPYSTKTVRHDGTVLGRGFQSSRKAEFANHVLQHGEPRYFANFQSLQEIVIGVLRSDDKT